jgi:hypothetical protein
MLEIGFVLSPYYYTITQVSARLISTDLVVYWSRVVAGIKE